MQCRYARLPKIKVFSKSAAPIFAIDISAAQLEKRNLGLSNGDYKNLLQGHAQAYEPKSTPKTDSGSPEGL